jgi:hypothetical protein
MLDFDGGSSDNSVLLINKLSTGEDADRVSAYSAAPRSESSRGASGTPVSVDRRRREGPVCGGITSTLHVASESDLAESAHMAATMIRGWPLCSARRVPSSLVVKEFLSCLRSTLAL